MPRTMQRSASAPRDSRPAMTFARDRRGAQPFTLEQELAPFGNWVGEPIWVPPQDSSDAMAETMFQHTPLFASRETRWNAVIEQHRDNFTQVREFDMLRPSIRLPQGRIFVTVTDQKDFDKITDTVPHCVRTRLDEFLSGPGKKHGTKVYYLKPLCVEVGNQLVFTTQEDLTDAIAKIKADVFTAYRQLALYRRPLQALRAIANVGLALPRTIVNYSIERRRKALDAYHAQLELKRRKLALRAANHYRQLRSGECTFDEMLALTTPLKREEVIEQYCVEQELTRAKRAQLLRIDSGTLPWFVALSLTAAYVTSLALTGASSVAVCDPAFVAEFPDAPGVLLKIGHFDEIDGITHIEI